MPRPGRRGRRLPTLAPPSLPPWPRDPSAGSAPARPSRPARPGRTSSGANADRPDGGSCRGSCPWPPWCSASSPGPGARPTGTRRSTPRPSNHFDVAHGQPQPPGYWLYVETGRALHLVTGLGTIASLVMVAALASAAGVGLTAVAGRDLGGPWVGLAAGVVVATSPFAWFSGSTVATYSFDMLACALLIVLAWRARPGSWHGVGAVVALGLLAGFRQSDLMAFAILALIAVVGSTRRWSRLGMTVAGRRRRHRLLVRPDGAQPARRVQHAGCTPPAPRPPGRPTITSVLDHAAGAATNTGTFAAYTALALAPLAVAHHRGRCIAAPDAPSGPLGHGAGRRRRPADDDRSRRYRTGPGVDDDRGTSHAPVVLGAAIVPPVLTGHPHPVRQGRVPAGLSPRRGDRPAAPPGRPQPAGRRPRSGARWSGCWSARCWSVRSPCSEHSASSARARSSRRSGRARRRSLWLVQPRYQAPYPDTLRRHPQRRLDSTPRWARSAPRWARPTT